MWPRHRSSRFLGHVTVWGAHRLVMGPTFFLWERPRLARVPLSLSRGWGSPLFC